MISLRHVRLKSSNWLIVGAIAFAALAALSVQASEEGAPSPILEKLGPSISLRGAFWDRDKSYSSRRGYLASSAWLTLRPKEVLSSKLFFDGYLAKNDTIGSPKYFAEAREAYLERSMGSLDLRIGRQVIVWGRGDKVNPTDQWSSKNFTLLTTDDEDSRLGAGALNLALNLDRYRLIAIWQPEWRMPNYPIPPISGISLSYVDPGKAAYRQFGLKLDQTGGDFDGSLSFFNGPSRTPNLSVLSAGPTGVNVGLNFETVQVYGGDIAFNLGSYGFRAEAAYTASADSAGTDPLKFNPEFYGVLGADRTLFENLNLNFQFLYKHVFKFQNVREIADPNTQSMAVQQNLISNQLRNNQLGISFRPSYKFFNETLEVEAAYVQWFYNPGGLLRPKATYAVNDHLKAIAGGEVYFGQRDSFFGRLQDVSSVFTELRYSF
ncbi:MAG: hypothetical protein JNL01_12710 [Bdellovibrionales bacterium]|nr:hypothetical protein [Bdellovibrionales bacterium]